MNYYVKTSFYVTPEKILKDFYTIINSVLRNENNLKIDFSTVRFNASEDELELIEYSLQEYTDLSTGTPLTILVYDENDGNCISIIREKH